MRNVEESRRVIERGVGRECAEQRKTMEAPAEYSVTEYCSTTLDMRRSGPIVDGRVRSSGVRKTPPVQIFR